MTASKTKSRNTIEVNFSITELELEELHRKQLIINNHPAFQYEIEIDGEKYRYSGVENETKTFNFDNQRWERHYILKYKEILS